jgi:hypothetical protein
MVRHRKAALHRKLPDIARKTNTTITAATKQLPHTNCKEYPHDRVKLAKTSQQRLAWMTVTVLLQG